MTAPTRNFCLARGNHPTSNQSNVYVVPSGHSAIIKGALFNSGGFAATQVDLWLGERGGGTIYVFHGSVDASGLASWAGWLVLNDGDSIGMTTYSTNVWYWISGALLPYAPGQVAPA